jgi:branched-chain amino acid transport system permease protein
MQALAIALVPAIVLGVIYGTLATGYVLLFRTVRILSFAQGAFMLVGALVFSALIDKGWNLLLALLIALLCSGAAGAATYLVVYGHNRLAGADHMLVAFSTVGLYSMLLAILYLTWGSDQRPLSALSTGWTWHISNQMTVSQYQGFIVLACAIVVGGILLWLRYTSMGTRARAVASGPNLANYYGINVRRVSATAWGLAGLLAGLAGVCFSLTQSIVDPVGLPVIAIAAFPAIIIGGIDSLGGAMVGGLIVAILASFISVQFGGQYQDVVGYALLLFVLLVRPSGLFGSKTALRV